MQSIEHLIALKNFKVTSRWEVEKKTWELRSKVNLNYAMMIIFKNNEKKI